MFCSFFHTLSIQSIFVFINRSVTKFFRSLIPFNNYLIDAFELWCWRRLLRAPWTARRSNQSILKEISPEYSFEGLMLKLKLQFLVTCCKELTPLKRPWCWESLKAGGEWDDRGWDDWKASSTRWTWVWASSGGWWWTGKLGVLQSMGSQKAGHDCVTELQSHDTYICCFKSLISFIFVNLSKYVYRIDSNRQRW